MTKDNCRNTRDVPPFKTLHLVVLFIAVALYRICNALALQTQFDPDEYWQTLEPAYCLAFSSGEGVDGNCKYTWEWTRRYSENGSWIDRALHGPVRSHVPILPTFLFYWVLKFLHWDTTWLVARGPVLWNAVFVAAPTDVAIYYISGWIWPSQTAMQGRRFSLGRPECWAVLCSVTSWFHAYALVRTYSNSMETMFVTVGIALLCPELFGPVSNEVLKGKRRPQIRPLAAFAFILGGLSLLVRFTALAVWVPMGLIICLRRVGWKDMVFHLFYLCAFFGIIGISIGCLIDRVFYGFWAVPFLGSFQFNVIEGNGSLYGEHPFYWYVVVGFPAITGALLPSFCYEMALFVRRRREVRPKETSPNDTLIILILSYVLLHSISAHKEFRFILPILPLVCILSGSNIHNFTMRNIKGIGEREFDSQRIYFHKSSYIICFLLALNFPHLYFLSSIHQRASIEVNRKIANQIECSMKSGVDPNQVFHIHYLMGCHSTPLYSHLHVPMKMSDGTRKASLIKAWTLDCSPDCRIDARANCESDEFIFNPSTFMERSYISTNQCVSQSENVESHYCNDAKKSPHFLILSEDSQDFENLRKLARALGMIEYEKIPQEIKHVQIAKSHKESSIHQFLGANILDISFTHYYLYIRKDLLA